MTGLQMEPSTSNPQPFAPGRLSIFATRDDVVMTDSADIGPSTAPIQNSGPTFFHDD